MPAPLTGSGAGIGIQVGVGGEGGVQGGSEGGGAIAEDYYEVGVMIFAEAPV